jgi:ceramide glucosyltransferase
MTTVWTVLLILQILFWLGSLWLGPRAKESKAGRSTDPLPGPHRPPTTFFRPIKSGILDLDSHLRRFIEITEPGDQILFGLTADQEKEIAVCGRLKKRDVQIRTIICEPDRLPNPKVSKLSQMEEYARHDVRLLVDTEAGMTRDLLNDLLHKSTRGNAVTALYGFPSPRNDAQLSDAINSCCFLWAGTVWTRRFAAQDFVFGACVLFRKEHLRMIGGWDRLGKFLAEDYHFGRSLMRIGVRIGLADQPLNLESDALTWSTHFEHQRRVALTYRVTNPIGYFGSIVTQTVPTLLLAVLSDPAPGLALLLPMVLFRSGVHHQILRRLNVDVSFWKVAFLTPLSLITETSSWITSWFPSTILWGNRRYRVSADGTIENVSVSG